MNKITEAITRLELTSKINEIIDDKVSKSGDTMSGDLIITRTDTYGSFTVKSSTFDATTTTAPSSWTGIGSFIIKDKNGYMTAYMQNALDTSNMLNFNVGARRIIGGVNKDAVLRLQVNSSGTASCSFPNTTCVDGRWIPASQTVTGDNPVNVNGSTPLHYTLNIPNDGHDYEVIIVANIITGTTSGNSVTAQVYSDLHDNWINIVRAQTRSASSVQGSGVAIVPVSSSRKLHLTRDTGYNGTVVLYMRGYRRLGTNS